LRIIGEEAEALETTRHHTVGRVLQRFADHYLALAGLTSAAASVLQEDFYNNVAIKNDLTERIFPQRFKSIMDFWDQLFG